MPDNWRFSDEEIEQCLSDLGSRIEYPPTPDVARTVLLRLDEEQSRRARRAWRWPALFAPRWTAVAAALVLISVIALSPTVRTTLSDFLAPGDQAGSGAGGSAARPETDDRSKQDAGVASEAVESSSPDGASGCTSPSIEAEPARATAGAKFRLRGSNFSSGCDGVSVKPARGIRIYLRQGGKTWKLTTLDAGHNLTFDASLRVPAGAEPGRATVRATIGSGGSVEERFVVLR